MGRGIRKRSAQRLREERAFFRLLRKARLDAGLTQTEAADRLGRSQSYVAKVETGARGLDVFELREFARVYHKPLAYFFGE